MQSPIGPEQPSQKDIKIIDRHTCNKVDDGTGKLVMLTGGLDNRVPFQNDNKKWSIVLFKSDSGYFLLELSFCPYCGRDLQVDAAVK